MQQKHDKKFLSGNAAIARGAWEAGVKFASAYPGTPSTEILEYLGKYKEVDAQWSVNEKTSMETAIGASYGGVRALCSQKHVGLNVAADPFFTVAYMGVNAGLVIVTADDPGMHSSQNEQDNRNYARHAKIPMFEPSDSQEAKDMTIKAFEISEKFDTPVLLRTTTRVSHSESIVKLGERKEIAVKNFEKNISRCALPNIAREKHIKVEKRLEELRQESETIEFNKIEKGSESIGIITSGISYCHAKEVFPEASYLKLGMTFPLPSKLIKEFASSVKKLVIIEENDPFLETEIKAMGIKCIGKGKIPICGELNPDIIHSALREYTNKNIPETFTIKQDEIPARPPVLCPGCPHRGVYYNLNKLKCTVTGDIGCYSLGAYPPHNAVHSIVCMGASITAALGMTKAFNGTDKNKPVAVIGESTFMHSGMTGLLDTVYNKGSHLTIILDNSITAMTGHQPNPASGKTLKGEKTRAVDLKRLCEAIGIDTVKIVDPFDLAATEKAIKDCLSIDGPTVIIAKRPCFLLKDYKPEIKPVSIDTQKCVKCGMCQKLGCPAIEIAQDTGKTLINETLCVHCGLCAQVCKPGAITQAK